MRIDNGCILLWLRSDTQFRERLSSAFIEKRDDGLRVADGALAGLVLAASAVGFVFGYGVREAISQHRRAEAKRRVNFKPAISLFAEFLSRYWRTAIPEIATLALP